MKTDCYKLLDIPSNADKKTIRKAYRIKTKEIHPDLNKSPDAENQFTELSDALALLLDEAGRIKHDHQFGYSGPIKNKYSNRKQQFTSSQNEKAKLTVNEWSEDYSVAMGMREMQRKKHLAKHRRNQILIIIGTVILALISILLVINLS